MNICYYAPGKKGLPEKHQLLIAFEDESCIMGSARMYGGIWCFPADSFECNFSSYRDGARSKPQVLSDAFNKTYFLSLDKQRRKTKRKQPKHFWPPNKQSQVWETVFYRIFSSGLVSILKHASAHYRINRKTLCFIALKIRFRIFI